MSPVHINYAAVVVSAIVAMGIGALWYSPMLFAKQWMKEVGKAGEDMSRPGPAYLLTALGSLLMAYIMAHFVDYAQAQTLTQGAAVGLWAWLGFVVPSIGSEHLFAGKTKNLYLITVGHYLVTFVVVGAILGVWV